jgi:WD40 repeat protein/serine/threonine protein kinase
VTEEQVFLAALELADPAERAAYLDRACGGDAAFRRQVEALLAAHFRSGEFLDSPAVDRPREGALPDATATANLGPDGANVPAVPPADSGGVTADDRGLDERAGTVVAGKYTLVEVIGEGGMGSVWRARQTEPVKRFVAVKLIKAGMDSRRVLARFEAERQALALMDHPNIAKVLDGGLHGHRPFFVMELVKGVPITDFCDAHRLTPRQRLELFVPVCQAIQHAHQKGIIHRDVKPSNVLIALYDDKPVVKVIDFGVAKATGGALTEQTIDTGFGALVGTPQYMSPEQATVNNLDIDTRSDVYALGVLLYELLTGSPPFARKELEKKGLLEVLRVVREEEPPRPSTRLSTADALPSLSANRGTEPKKLTGLLRNELDWIVMKALEKDRGRRYETANGFAADVLRYLGGEAVRAHPPSTAYRLKKFVRRNKGPVIAASLVLFALLAGMAGTTGGLIEARRQEQEARKQEQVARDETAAKEQARAAEAERVRERDQALGQAKDALASEADRVKERDAALALEVQRVKERDAALEESKYQLNTGNFLLAVAAYDGADIALAGRRLESVRPEQRGWEWHYLRRQATGGIFTISPGASVIGVAFSPDGARIVTGGRDHTARVWDARTGSPLLELKGHTDTVRSVAFSPDGTWIITSSDDRTARVWDARTAAPGLVLKGHAGAVWSAAFSPDGTRIVTGSEGGTATVWDARTAVPQFALKGHTESVHSAAFSPDGTRIVTGGGAHVAKVWDARTGTMLHELMGHGHIVMSVAFSPDGTRILTGCGDQKARMWDARTGTIQRTLKGHTSGVESVAFSPDGTRIVTGSTDQTVKVWDAETGTVQLDLKGHTSRVMSVAISPDGYRIVSGSWDGTAKMWDARTGTPQIEVKGHIHDVSSVAFSPDGARIITGSWDRTAKVWDARTGALQLTLTGHTEWVKGVAFSPDGTRIVTASWDRTAKVWDAETGARLQEMEGHTDKVSAVAFSPDGARIITGSWDRTAKVWDARTGALQLTLSGHTESVGGVAFSPDGTRIVTGSTDQTVKVWEARTGALQLTLTGHASQVEGVAFSPDGGRIVSGSWDGTAKVWDARTGTPQFELKGHKGLVCAVAFSPDGGRIVTGGADETAIVWDARTGTPLMVLRGHTHWVNSVAFSPDGTRIVTGSQDQTARVWETRAGKELPDEEELAYRLLHTQPNFRRYREAYEAARAARDDVTARFYLGLLPPAERADLEVKAAAARGGELVLLAKSKLEAKAFTEAEPLLRECLALREKAEPDAWMTFNTRSLLGGALLGQKKYADAEPLLLKGYEGMKQREKAIPPQAATRIPEALDRLIELYTATDKPDEAKKWRDERAKYPPELAPMSREKK